MGCAESIVFTPMALLERRTKCTLKMLTSCYTLGLISCSHYLRECVSASIF